MDKIFDKFNMFDVFTTLIPGSIILMLWCFISSNGNMLIFGEIFGMKYLSFAIASYFLGLVLQELGCVLDEKVLFKILYGDNPRKIFLTKDLSKRLIRNPVNHAYIESLRDDVLKKTKMKESVGKYTEEDVNSFVFSYCMNVLEINGLNNKFDKMLILSELSRSIFWGSAGLFLWMLYKIHFADANICFLYEKMCMLIIICLLFAEKKVRYERYRYTILLRYYKIVSENSFGNVRDNLNIPQ